MLVVFLSGDCIRIVMGRPVIDHVTFGDVIFARAEVAYLAFLLLELLLEVLKEVRVEVLTSSLSVSSVSSM